MIPNYMSVAEATAAAADETDKALGAVLAMLSTLYFEKRSIRLQLECTDDDDLIGELEWKLKHLKSEESSLHRIESGLQSRLKVGGV